MFEVHVDGWTYRFTDPTTLVYTHFTGNDQWYVPFPGLVYAPINLKTWEAAFA
jgi:hypothetical protein